MGSATVKTAAATQAILNQTVKEMAVKVDGSNPAWDAFPIGDLICTRWDDSFFSAGPVIGPEGDVGPAGPINAADLVDLKDDIGYGILAYDDVNVEQAWGFDEDGWNEITGISVTFNQVTGRRYRITWGILMSSGADNVTFDTECRDGATVMGRGQAFAPNDGRVANAGATWEYTAGTTGSKTFKLHARGNTPNDIHVQSDYLKTFLSVADIGTI